MTIYSKAFFPGLLVARMWHCAMLYRLSISISNAQFRDRHGKVRLLTRSSSHEEEKWDGSVVFQEVHDRWTAHAELYLLHFPASCLVKGYGTQAVISVTRKELNHEKN